VQDETVTIPAEAFRRVKAWSSSEIRRELPLRDLPADTYLLTFTITSGNETIKRDVTFTRH
jgi:hypothetical protein